MSHIDPFSSRAISPSLKNITAVILAGGASSRMGRDKALIEWRGRPFIAHIVECLRTQVQQIAINTLTTADYSRWGLPLVTDATPERCGPLAGIMAALSYSTTAFTLVVPCDNPFISSQLVARLSVALEENSDLAYARVGSDNHYLYALMRTDLRDDLVNFLRGRDYAVRHWYATVRASGVDFSDQAECFRNINSPADLALLPKS